MTAAPPPPPAIREHLRAVERRLQTLIGLGIAYHF